MASPKGYIKVDRGLLAEWPLGMGEWWLYCHLANAAAFREHGGLKVGQTDIGTSELMKLTGLSRPAVIRYKKRLAEAGLIEIVERKNPLPDIMFIGKRNLPVNGKQNLPSMVNEVYQPGKRDLPVTPYIIPNGILEKNVRKNEAKRARVREETAQNPQVQTPDPETPETTIKKWFEMFSQRTIAIEQYCMTRGVTPEVYHRCAAIAFSELELEGRTAESYRDYGDFSRHLQNRIRVKISSKEYESNSNNNQPGSREQRVAELYASFAARATAGRHAGAGVFDT